MRLLRIKRPIVWVLGFYIAGVLACEAFDKAPFAAVAGAFVLLAATVFSCARLKNAKILLLLPVFFIGALLMQTQKHAAFDDIDGEGVRITGVVYDIYETDYGYRFLTVKARYAEVNGERINLGVFGKNVSVMSKSSTVPVIYGQEVSALGFAEKLSFARNPGARSESVMLRARGYAGKMRDSEVSTGKMKRLDVYLSRVAASRIKALFEDALPSEMAALMNAMILGESVSGGAEVTEIRENFKKTGASHILSVSGLHLTMLAMLIFELLRAFGLRLKGGSLATIGFLWVYAAFTGMSVSVLRAVIMSTILLARYALKRPADTYASMSFAALVILLSSPLYLWDAGFLLSFSAVSGMALLMPLLKPALERAGKIKLLASRNIKIPKSVINGAAATIAATLFTMPVCAYFFSAVSLSGVFVNLLIVPLSGVILGAGFIYAALGLLGAFFVSEVVASVIFTVLFYFIKATGFFASLPFSYVVTGRPRVYNIVSFYVVLLLVCAVAKLKSDRANRLIKARRRERMKLSGETKNAVLAEYANLFRNKTVAASAIFAAALLVIINILPFFNRNTLEIAFLDVKQGDATALHFPENIDIIIDGGGNMLTEIGANTGVKVVYPYLSYKGITKLDAVFLTHPDMDHAAGIIELLGLIKVRRLFISDINGIETDTDVMRAVLHAAEENGVPVTKIKSGYKAQIGNALIECVYPLYSGRLQNVNDGSLTLKITHGENTFLFTGDIEAISEQKLLASGNDIRSKVLKVPHHGSETSSTEAFVAAVSPDFGLIGSGKNNSFGHPSPSVVETYGNAGVTLFNTANDGAVIIRSNLKDAESPLIITTMREGSHTIE